MYIGRWCSNIIPTIHSIPCCSCQLFSRIKLIRCMWSYDYLETYLRCSLCILDQSSSGSPFKSVDKSSSTWKSLAFPNLVQKVIKISNTNQLKKLFVQTKIPYPLRSWSKKCVTKRQFNQAKSISGIVAFLLHYAYHCIGCFYQ